MKKEEHSQQFAQNIYAPQPEEQPHARAMPARLASAVGDSKPTHELKSAFEDDSYKESRNRWIQNIPRASKFASVERYIGGVALGCFSLAFGAMLNPAIPVAVIVGFIVAGVAASLVGAHAHYQNRRVSDPINLERSEQADIARSKMMGESIALAFDKNKTQTMEAPSANLQNEPEQLSHTAEKTASPTNWQQQMLANTATKEQTAQRY